MFLFYCLVCCICNVVTIVQFLLIGNVISNIVFHFHSNVVLLFYYFREQNNIVGVISVIPAFQHLFYILNEES